MYNQYNDEGTLPTDDPFSDTPQPQLIGQGYYKLEALAYLIDNPAQIHLIRAGQNLKNTGKLEVNIIPVDETGWGEIQDSQIPEKPEDLIDRRLDFVVTITKALDLPPNFCKDVFIEYSFYLDESPYQTPIIPGKH